MCVLLWVGGVEVGNVVVCRADCGVMYRFVGIGRGIRVENEGFEVFGVGLVFRAGKIWVKGG